MRGKVDLLAPSAQVALYGCRLFQSSAVGQLDLARLMMRLAQLEVKCCTLVLLSAADFHQQTHLNESKARQNCPISWLAVYRRGIRYPIELCSLAPPS